MQALIIVDNTKHWPLHFPGVDVVDARTYVTSQEYSGDRGMLVFNLCRSYRYQSLGYYVSLIAAARGHRPVPAVTTIQDMKSVTLLRYASEDLEEMMQHCLRPLQSKEFTLSIYFGQNMARRYDKLCKALMNAFHVPLMRAHFTFEEQWELQRIAPIGAKDIPDEHWEFVLEAAKVYFSRPRFAVRKKPTARYDIAILHNPEEKMPPSNERALRKFERAAKALGMEPEFIEKEDYGRLAEFDALFIRETTQVNHHTFRFAQRAAADGLVVIDDPESILRCSNKVYLAELLGKNNIRTPKTVIVHRDNYEDLHDLIGLPCILKQPDSFFSQGVIKVNDRETLLSECERLLDRSELIIAQEFMPTTFDWRVGVLNREPLYVCRYHMASKHWQIQKTEQSGNITYGEHDCVPIEATPSAVIKTAVKAANLIGDGLYGVDLKEHRHQVSVIEVNDNPSIDAGVEDSLVKDELYNKIMGVFLSRIEALKEPGTHK
ncbi:MAG: 30S ribosomal protein S6 modification protein [Candidatus Hydrogenedentota bacterium]